MVTAEETDFLFPAEGLAGVTTFDYPKKLPLIQNKTKTT